MPFNPFKKGDWDKLGKQAKNEFNQVERALREVGEDVKKGLQKTGADCRNGIRVMGREVEDGITKELPKLAEKAVGDAVAAILRAASKKSLETALDIIDTVMPDSTSLTFGPVVIEVGDVYAKVETIRALAQNPPGRAQEITDAVISLAPASVHINLTVGLGFVVQSDSAQVGIDLGWSGDSVLEHLPALLEKCGVPA